MNLSCMHHVTQSGFLRCFVLACSCFWSALLSLWSILRMWQRLMTFASNGALITVRFTITHLSFLQFLAVFLFLTQVQVSIVIYSTNELFYGISSIDLLRICLISNLRSIPFMQAPLIMSSSRSCDQRHQYQSASRKEQWHSRLAVYLPRSS